MTPSQSIPSAQPRPGRIEQALLRWLSRPVTITAVEAPSPRFRVIELAGEALRGLEWTPGQKIQIAISGMRVARTYTPMSWDAVRGVTRILIWMHGNGPGSDWAARAAPGDPCLIMGPRRSIEVPAGPEPLVVLGDETAFGLAAALGAADPGRPLHCLFEAADTDESATVFAGIGIEPDMLARRAEGDEGHLVEIAGRLSALADKGAIFALAGRALAIQRLSQALKALGVTTARLRTKAYWAPGKTGLD